MGEEVRPAAGSLVDELRALANQNRNPAYGAVAYTVRVACEIAERHEAAWQAERTTLQAKYEFGKNAIDSLKAELDASEVNVGAWRRTYDRERQEHADLRAGVTTIAQGLHNRAITTGPYGFPDITLQDFSDRLTALLTASDRNP